MIIKVHPHKVEIIKTPVNEKEVNITTCNFEFDEEFNGLIKDAYFTLNGQSYKQIIQDDQCNIPSEVLTEKGSVELGVVAYEVQDEELIERYNPSPDYFDTWSGSLKENAENAVPITPTDKEQIEALIQEVQAQMDNLDVEAEKVEHTTTITITRKDGTSYDVEILDGEQGPQGEPGQPGAIKMVIVEELPETGSGDTLYFVPKEDAETSDLYDEYAWVNNDWERLGEKQIVVDLTDYVKNTDYATASKGGVIKVGSAYNAYSLTSEGYLQANIRTYEQYQQDGNKTFIGKGTLENVITGKGLVSNTDYATASTGGVVKISQSGQGIYLNQNGVLTCYSATYSDYQSKGNTYFISKGTLENVLTATIGDIQTLLDALDSGAGV